MPRKAGPGRPRKAARNDNGELRAKIIEKEKELVDVLLTAATSKPPDLRSAKWLLEQLYGQSMNETERSLLEEKTKLTTAQRKLAEQQARLTSIKIDQEENRERLLDLLKRKASPEVYQAVLAILGTDETESSPAPGDRAASPG